MSDNNTTLDSRLNNITSLIDTISPNQQNTIGSGFLLPIGALIENRYEVLKCIGQGGMSVVYLAHDIKENRLISLKKIKNMIPSDGRFANHTLNDEILLMMKMSSPYFPNVYEVIDDGGDIIIAMEYFPGEDLQIILSRIGAIDQKAVRRIGIELCKAVDYLHSQDPPIIFRDIKPANIILQPDGKIGVVDFGIAKELIPGKTTDAAGLGTKGYASPEHFNGFTDQRSDIFSLGATLHHLLTGVDPRADNALFPIREMNPHFSAMLEFILLKCTAENPADRYQSCKELLADLKNDKLFLNPPVSINEQVRILSQKRPFAHYKTSSSDVSDRSDWDYNTTCLEEVLSSDNVTTPLSVKPNYTIVLSDETKDNPDTTDSHSTNESPRPPVPHLRTSTPQHKNYIFISYSHKDKYKATNVIELMMQYGFRVWFDSGIDPGSEWAETITEHIKKCSYFISLISRNYLESENCTGELNYSVGRVKNRLLIYLENVSLPDKYELHHGKIQAIHRYRYTNENEFISVLYTVKGLDRSLFTDESDAVISSPIQPKPEPFRLSVFVAYSLRDYFSYARAMTKSIEASDISVWHKINDCSAEDQYVQEAIAAINKSNRYVFFLSKELLHSEDEMTVLRHVLSENHPREEVFGIVTGNNLSAFSDLFDKMTIVTCSHVKMLDSIVQMITLH